MFEILQMLVGFVVVIYLISIVTSPTGVGVAFDGSLFVGCLVWETLIRIRDKP